MSGLRIATKKIALDPDYVGGGTFALLAKKGAGKTYAMRVMAEEFWAHDVPFVALDPMDAFWGLRSSADGEGEGIPVAIFGGPHADAPLEETAGKLMADLVIEERLSMVLSLKSLGTRAAERRFAKDFLDRLYRKNEELVHLLIDETDLFAPQKPQAGDQPLLGVTENIVRRGRNNGIGITMATQRPAVLNKDVLTQVDGLIVMRMLGPNDRNAIDAWLGEHDSFDAGAALKGQLPSLGTGEAYIWVPELDVLEKTKIRPARTFDSSPTRKRGGAKKRAPRGYADVDMGQIESKMADTIEREKAKDPKHLQRRVRELEAELKKRPQAEPEVEEVSVFTDDDRELLSAIQNDLGANLMGVLDAFNNLRPDLGRIGDQLSELRERAESKAPSPRQARARSEPRPRPATAGGSPREREAGGGRREATSRPPAPPSAANNGEVTLDKAMRSILSVLLQYPQGRSKKQLGILAGYSPNTGGFNNAIGRLRSAGLITPARVEPIRAMPEAEGLIEIEPLPSGRELLDYWLSRLGKAERAILEVLYASDGLDKETLAERAGYQPNTGGFNNALGRLRTRELISPAGQNPITISEELL